MHNKRVDRIKSFPGGNCFVGDLLEVDFNL